MTIHPIELLTPWVEEEERIGLISKVLLRVRLRYVRFGEFEE